jgi:hypothetical protein
MPQTIFSLLLLFAAAASLPAQIATPEPEQKLAHDIYKEFIEIQSGYTTGATTPVAEAAARYLRAAGFPDADIFLGGASPKKFNLVVRYHGTGAKKARHGRRQGAGGGLDRDADPLQAGELSSRSRHHRGADRG